MESYNIQDYRFYQDKIFDILVVEDNEVYWKFFEALSEENQSFRFYYVANLGEAQKLLKKRKFHIVLLDLNLPDSQDLETYYKFYELFPEVPVIIFTVTDDLQKAHEAIQQGAYDYIIKEKLNIEILNKALRYAIGRKYHELASEGLMARLNQLKKFEAIGKIAKVLADEMENIFGSIIGYSSLLHNELKESPKSFEKIKKIGTAANRGASLIEQLLRVSHFSQNQKKAVDLNEIIGRIIKLEEISGFHDSENKYKISMHLCDDSLNIIGNALKLNSMIVELISNSKKAMPNGGKIKIVSELKKATELGIDEYLFPNKVAMIKVYDEGYGIPKKDLSKIFDPFFSSKPSEINLGMGLAEVYNTVQVHEGLIQVESEVGKGTEFTVYFNVK